MYHAQRLMVVGTIRWMASRETMTHFAHQGQAKVALKVEVCPQYHRLHCRPSNPLAALNGM
jgi:hypothetical protein